MNDPILTLFHPIVRSWFVRTFGEPTAPQVLGWEPISRGKSTLIVAPTGTGKTIAAFLWCINHLIEERIQSPEKRPSGVEILYISPLKALNNDIHRNLEEPLNGIHAEAQWAGVKIPRIRAAVRTGDTTQAQRRSIVTHPPDILITTPESLYLMLTSKHAKNLFTSVRYVIVDEIHSLAPTKRGVHLSLSLERLEETAAASFVRIGLSATQKPLEPIAQFLAGNAISPDGTLTPREVAIVDAGRRKELDIRVKCAAYDFSDLPQDSVWPLIYPELIKAIGMHKTTLIFVNNRRLAERIAAKLNEILAGAEHMINLNAVPRYADKEGVRRQLAAAAETGSDDDEREEEERPPRDELTIQAYHSSMSRQTREQMEHDLKRGRLRALVATSSLELGIDIGTVDLVIQIQSPKSIARGIQRVGRSGHIVHATSKGRLFPTHREDLVECAVIAREMLDYTIESTRIPMNCLDVLAQQITASVSIEEWDADRLYGLVRRSSCYHTLTREMFFHVVDMLSGRYTSQSFRNLRSRIVFDKKRNILSALPGTAHQAIMGAGTIPDRGYYGVYLTDKKTKIGEVDEEFIYESRTGDTFILGSNVWKMVEIDANRVLVEPAPGQPARMPFWKGEGMGRTYELSRKVGEFREYVAGHIRTEHRDESDESTGGLSIGWEGTIFEETAVDEAFQQELQERYSLDHNAAWNIIDYIGHQKRATGTIPSHRTILVEGFRDEIGDPRIVVHACFGRSINALLGIVLKKTLQEKTGIDVQMLYNDDGILFRTADLERLPLDLFGPLTSLDAQAWVIDELPSTPLFASVFRQNAERSLLLPKALPGKRMPLWVQRLRAGDLLQIVRRSNDFPIVIETFRDCLNDVLDLEHFKEVIDAIATGAITVHTVQRETASPFAQSVLFEFIAVYMYEGDRPRPAQKAVPVNTDLLREVVDLESVSSVITEEARAKIEEQLQFTAQTRRARSASELFDIVLRLGELTLDELEARTDDRAFIDELIAQGSISRVTIGGRAFFIASEEEPIYAAAFSPSADDRSEADADTRPMIDPVEARVLVAVRSLRTRGIVDEQFFRERYAIAGSQYGQFYALLCAQEDVVCGHFTSADKNELASRSNLERIHHASLALKRREIRPASLPQFADFLAHWQHRHPSTTVRGQEGFHDVIDQMIGLALPQEVWEPEVFARRMSPYDSQALRRLAQSGELIGRGNETGKILWFWRGEGACFCDDAADAALDGLSQTARDIYSVLSERGALFLSDLRAQTVFQLSAINKALSELFWAGLVTNDSADELLKIKKFRTQDDPLFPDEKIALIAPSRNPLRFAAARSVREALRNTPGWNGRWSVIHQPGILGPALTLAEKARRQAEQLLMRYGIVAREVARREQDLLPWSTIAFELQRMELRGEIRRGYFVEGLSGMQFALPEAGTLLERLRETPPTLPGLVINACDPALPYGQGIDLQPVPVRISRLPQNFCALHNGAPLAWFEGFGSRISTAPDISEGELREALTNFISYVRSMHHLERTAITIEYCNDQRPSSSPMEPALRSLGFYRDRVQTMRLDL
ncbi:MAG: DEAD/DEAH box helicase [Acidobacteriota bacterium]